MALLWLAEGRSHETIVDHNSKTLFPQLLVAACVVTVFNPRLEFIAHGGLDLEIVESKHKLISALRRLAM